MPALIRGYNTLMEAIHADTVFEKPALFIRGENSGSIRDQDWNEILQLFPKAQLLTIADAGHWVHADQPQALSRAIQAFIDA